jgi:hypothetical protein
MILTTYIFLDINLHILLIIGQHIPRDIEKEVAKEMAMEKTKKGWMNGEVFIRWLRKLDDDLDQPTLLLMDSAGSHNTVEPPL